MLRPGGRVALMVWAGSDRQPYFRATAGVILERLGLAQPPAEQSVPYRFAQPGPLESALTEAGFSEVEHRTRTVNWTPGLSPEQARDEWWSNTPFWRPLIDRIPESDRAAAREEIANRLRPYYVGGELRLPETVRIVTAAR